VWHVGLGEDMKVKGRLLKECGREKGEREGCKKG
jgi:hypothetical protein